MSQSLDYNYEYDLPEQPEDEDEYYDENPDRSYSFQFTGDAYSREEAAEADGSVTGTYSYTDQAGEQRTVNYRAGAGIGFEVIDPEVDQMFASFGQKMAPSSPPQSFAPPPPSVGATEPGSLYGAPALPSYKEESLPGYTADTVPAASDTRAQPAGMAMDPSYYFEYQSADSERTEDADSSGVVVGSYRYRTAGGNDIEVRYRAGADTGFVVENADELAAALENAAAEVPLVKASSEQENIVIAVPTPLSGAPPAPQPGVLYSAPPPEIETSYGVPAEEPGTLYGAPLPSYEEEVVAVPSVVSAKAAPAGMVMDKSYSFAYSEEDSGREEAADSAGVVQGEYSYTNPEGNIISVRYRAGADIGFVVENAEELTAQVRKATDDGAAVAAARRKETQEAESEISTSYSHPQADPLPLAAPDTLYGAPAAPEADFALPLPSYNEPSAPHTLYGAPSENIATSGAAPAMVMDASFNFKVDESDHSFQEEADQAGERTGSYSYISPAGDSIEVRYRAGRDGFVILNPEDVLPIAPTL